MSTWRAIRNWSNVVARSAFWFTPDVALGPFDRSHRVTAWCMHRWSQSVCDGLGIQRELFGAEHLASTGQCVMVANHQSLLDIVVIGSFVSRDFRWLAKDAIFRTPILGWHLRLAGHIPVYRGKRKHRNKDLPERIHRVVGEGASLLYFPEGTRSPDGRLQPFRRGAFVAAVQEDLPVLPLVVRGTGALMRKGARDLAVSAHRTCSVTVLPPIPAPRDGTPDERAVRLHDDTLAAMLAEIARADEAEADQERARRSPAKEHEVP